MSRRTGPLVRDAARERQRSYAAKRANPGTPVRDRLLMHVEVTASGCWQWQLALTPGTGYAGITIDKRRLLAHRLSYETFVGPIPDGLQLDHLCRNRGCINPQHLEPVTARVNSLRGVSFAAENARKTECPQGHPYDEVNTYYCSGRRQCRACRRAYRAALAARNVTRVVHHHHHGTLTGYSYGCRCDDCREARRKYDVNRKAQRAQAQPRAA